MFDSFIGKSSGEPFFATREFSVVVLKDLGETGMWSLLDDSPWLRCHELAHSSRPLQHRSTVAGTSVIIRLGQAKYLEPDVEKLDENVPRAMQIETLEEWTTSDNDSAAGFILQELEKDDLPAEWRNRLVYAAEDARFRNVSDQLRLCNRLRGLALHLRTFGTWDHPSSPVSIQWHCQEPTEQPTPI